MTTYGPPEYFRCNACSKHLYAIPLTSYSNFGRSRGPFQLDFVSIRSDGYDSDFSHQAIPPLVACPHCEAVFQTLGAKPIGIGKPWFLEIDNESDEDPDTMPQQFDDGAHYETASLASCLNYVAEHVIEPQYEAAIRVYVWQMANSAQRGSSSTLFSELERKNLEVLIEILKGSDGPRDILLQAEGLRELGQFDAAAALLDRDFTGTDAAFAIEILRATLQKDSNLFYVNLLDESETDTYAMRWIQMRQELRDLDESGKR